jgi:hypothetical protein
MARKTKLDSEKLRMQLWIKKFSEYLDSSFLKPNALDRLFAQEDWTIDKAESYQMSPRTVDRVRRFQAILDDFSTPRVDSSNRIKFNHKIPEIIWRVGRHPACAGSLEIFDSYFWDLMANDPLDKKLNLELLKKLLSLFQLEFLNGRDALDINSSKISQEYTIEVLVEGDKPLRMDKNLYVAANKPGAEGIEYATRKVYESLLNRTEIRNLPPSLDLLALHGCLYRKNFHEFNSEGAEVHYFDFLSILGKYIAQEKWLASKNGLLSDLSLDKELDYQAVRTVLNGIKDSERPSPNKAPTISKETILKFSGLRLIPKFWWLVFTIIPTSHYLQSFSATL